MARRGLAERRTYLSHWHASVRRTLCLPRGEPAAKPHAQYASPRAVPADLVAVVDRWSAMSTAIGVYSITLKCIQTLDTAF